MLGLVPMYARKTPRMARRAVDVGVDRVGEASSSRKRAVMRLVKPGPVEDVVHHREGSVVGVVAGDAQVAEMDVDLIASRTKASRRGSMGGSSRSTRS